MATISSKGKTYDIDEQGFLIDFNQWDEDFAVLMASKLNVPQGLTEKHWEVIRYIRESFHKNGICPRVYETCKSNDLTWRELAQLFPTGYLRGTCLISGITYKHHIVDFYVLPRAARPREKTEMNPREKIYHVDVYGFLIDHLEWNQEYAMRKAAEMKVPGGLSDKHWQIIHFLRERYEATGIVPTVYECCELNNIELEDLEKLFPDGYHRGAIKLAGLRVL